MNILLVDDDPIYTTLLGEILTLYSHVAFKAPDGEAAAAVLKREQIDVIISDVSMPKMNGVNLHNLVREDRRLKAIPFIWNSAYQELRDLLQISNPSLDYKFDKATQLANLLYVVGHVAAAKRIPPMDVMREPAAGTVPAEPAVFS